MKKNIFYLAAASALLLTACSQNEEMVNVNTAGLSPENAVMFDTYVPRSTTRALYGDITTDVLKNSQDGFGVFAYYTNDEVYDDSNSELNFMVNQRVRWDDEALAYPTATTRGAWTYSPLKYWPNEHGDKAISYVSRVDYLTFFAYAPYIPSDDLGGGTTSHPVVTEMSEAGDSGDPILKVTTSQNPFEQLDLLWGVASEKPTHVQTNSEDLTKVGFPFINTIKETVNGQIKFNFKHAFAKITLGDVVAIVDDVTPNANNEVANNTRIYVREVRIVGPLYEAGDAELNLNNTDKDTPNWDISVSRAGTDDIAYKFCDGVISSTADDDMKQVYYSDIDEIEGTTASGEYETDDSDEYGSLNPDIIQGGNGVTEIAKPLLREGVTGYYIYPGLETGAETYVEVVYDVETADPRLTGTSQTLTDGRQGSKVRNVIRKKLKDWTYDAGKCYKINMQIGMTSVKFDATVSEWDTTKGEKTPDLPANK